MTIIKTSLLISPALAPQQLRQLYRVSDSALCLPAVFCVLHGFISNEGEFRSGRFQIPQK